MENVQYFLENQVIEAIEGEFWEPDQKTVRIHSEFGQTVAHIDLYNNEEFLIVMPSRNDLYLSFCYGFRAELSVQLSIFLENWFHPGPHVMVLTPEFFDAYIENSNTAFDQYYEEYDSHMPLG